MKPAMLITYHPCEPNHLIVTKIRLAGPQAGPGGSAAGYLDVLLPQKFCGQTERDQQKLPVSFL